MVLPDPVVKPSQATVDEIMNLHPWWGNMSLYKELGIDKVVDPVRRTQLEGAARKGRNRWKKKRINLTIEVPLAREMGLKKSKQRVTLTKNMINNTVKGVISDRILKGAPLRPDKERDRKPLGKLSKKEVKKYIRQADGIYDDDTYPPTGLHWEGEIALTDGTGAPLADPLAPFRLTPKVYNPNAHARHPTTGKGGGTITQGGPLANAGTTSPGKINKTGTSDLILKIKGLKGSRLVNIRSRYRSFTPFTKPSLERLVDVFGESTKKVLGRVIWSRKGVVEPTFVNWFRAFLADPTKYNPYFPPGDVHDEIGEHLEDSCVPNAEDEYGDILQILMSRDHFKSTMVQEGFSVYHICEMTVLAKKGIFYVAYSDDLVERTFDNVIEHLSFNNKILSFYGYLIDSQKREVVKRGKKRSLKTGTAYFTYQREASHPGLKCATFQSGSVTGWHPGIMLLDDIEEVELSKAKMKTYKQKILKAFIPAVSITGIMVITGTIKGNNVENDIYLLLESNQMYYTYRYPAVVDVETGLDSFPPMSDVEYEIIEVPLLTKTGKLRKYRDGRLKTKRRTIITNIKNREKYKVTFPEKFTLEGLILTRMKYRFGAVKDMTDDDFFSEYQLRSANPHGKIFNMDRVFEYPPTLHGIQTFLDFRDLAIWCRDHSHPIYLFIDPGGKKSHGVAVIIAAHITGENWTPTYTILDCAVIKENLVGVGNELAKLIKKWYVIAWGVEGNFDQAETYGETLSNYVYNWFDKRGIGMYAMRATPYDTKGDKMKRINTQISTIIGPKEAEPCFFLNPESVDFDTMKTMLSNFAGYEMESSDEHQFDLLDALGLLRINMIGGASSIWFEAMGSQDDTFDDEGFIFDMQY